MEETNDEKFTFGHVYAAGSYNPGYEPLGVWTNAITDTDGWRERRESIPGHFDRT